MRHNLGKSSVRLIIAVCGVLVAVAGGLFLNSKFAEAAPFTFTQTSWIGGATATTAVHASNQTGWTQYSAASGVTAGATVALTPTSYAFVDDGATSTTPVSLTAMGGGFANGTPTNTVVNGTGTAANVGLATLAAGVGTDYPGYTALARVVFDNVTNSIWVADGSNLVKFNVLTAATTTYAMGSSNFGLAFDPFTTSVWVTGVKAATSTLSKVNATNGTFVDFTYPTGNTLGPIAFDSVTNSIWVVNTNLVNSVSKINASTGAMIATYPTGVTPTAIAFDSTTSSIWVLNQVDKSLSKINVTTGTKVDYLVGTAPRAIGFDGVTGSIWVGNSGAGFPLNKVNITTGTTVGTFVGPNGTPSALALETVTNSMWVSSTSGLAKYDATTGAKTVIAGYTSNNGIAFENITNSIWLSNAAGGCCNVSKLSVGGFASSGTFVSAVIDTGAVSAFSTMAFTTTIPASTALTMDVRAGNTAVPDGTWTAWTTNVLTGGSIAAVAGNRYFQYRANLSTTNVAATPTLNDVTINYSQYPTSGTLTSSIYNTGSANNSIVKLTWAATGVTATATLKFQVRSSADGVVWSNWCGPSVACAGTDYFLAADSGVALVAGHPLNTGGNDQYFQYQAFLGSDGSVTPTVTSVAVGYDTGAAGTPAPSPGGGGLPGFPVITNVATSTTTCTIPFTWNMSGVMAPNLYNVTRGIQYTTATSGANTLFPIIHGKNIVQARDGLTVLKSMEVECYYAL